MSFLACFCGTIAVVICLCGWRSLRGTTLLAPWAWSVFSLVSLTVYSISTLADARPAAGHLSYLAGLTTIAPFVALLGAKRPQDRAWQLIVASLLGLLAFQDARTWSLDPTQPPMPHAAWCCLVAGLIGMQLLNHLPTRYAPAACLACCAQVCSLGPCFRILPAEFRPAWLALPLLSGSIVLAALHSRRRTIAGDGIWADFRNLYGVLWALRVAERVNAIAAEKGLAVRLTWFGFQTADHSPATAPNIDETQEAGRTMRAILLRFVSQQWLAGRDSDP